MAEDPRADYAQVPGALRGSPQEPPGKGGSLPVQKHLPAGMWRELIKRIADVYFNGEFLGKFLISVIATR